MRGSRRRNVVKEITKIVVCDGDFLSKSSAYLVAEIASRCGTKRGR
jgi:hypothetical protein